MKFSKTRERCSIILAAACAFGCATGCGSEDTITVGDPSYSSDLPPKQAKEDNGSPGAESLKILGAYPNQTAIVVYDGGDYSKTVGCSGICAYEARVWIRFAVKNYAPTKSVGVRWTADGWKTQQEAYAGYESSFGINDFESWQVDFKYGSYYSNSTAPKIEFAAFVCYNNRCQDNERTWDRRNNYTKESFTVTPHRAVKLMSQNASYDGKQTVVTGQVAGYNYDSGGVQVNSSVDMIYTLDGWTTNTTVRATPQTVRNAHFTLYDYRIAVAGRIDQQPKELEFLPRLRVNTVGGSRLGPEAQVQAWDNNNGQNYRQKLKPELKVAIHQNLGIPFAGHLDIFCDVYQSIPDLKPTTELSFNKGPWQPGAALSATTHGIANGAVPYACRVTFADGTQMRADAQLQVQNSVVPNDFFTPTATTATLSQSLLDVLRTPKDELIVLQTNNVITKYAAFGDHSAPMTYASTLPAGATFRRIAVDDLGRLYVFATRGTSYPQIPVVYRYTDAGALDSSYNFQGELSKFGSFKVDVDSSDFVVTKNALHFAQQGGLKTVVFSIDHAGNDLGQLDLGFIGFNRPLFSRNGADLLLTSGREVYSLVETANGTLSKQAMVTLDTKALEAGFGTYSFSPMWRAADGSFWAIAADTNVVHYSAKGDLIGIWIGAHRAGSVGVSNKPGEIKGAGQLMILSDGRVLVAQGGPTAFHEFIAK